MQLATALDKDVFTQQNDLRQSPGSFIRGLQERLSLFNGLVYSPADGQPAADTIEGAAAVQDAINDLTLRSGARLNKLEWSPGLALAARDHCADAGKLGLVGPLGSNGQSPATRVAQYGDAGPLLGENLAYGGTQNGLEITMQLLLDDGVPSRTSRKLLFDPRWKYTGIATCAHSTKTMMASIMYSANDFAFNEAGLAKLAENPAAAVMPTTPQVPMVGGFERDVVEHIFALQNEIRVNPGAFLAELKARPGTAAVLEAVDAIENWNQTLSPLAWNNGLFLAARAHCNDLGPRQLIGPFGTDKSSPYDRISRFGSTDFWRAENRALTSDVLGEPASSVARQIVLDLFVDTSHGGRPQRQNLLNPNLHQVGVFTCPHGDQRFTVIDYAGQFEIKDSAEEIIGGLLDEHHPANPDAVNADGHCSSLPSTVVSQSDCEVFNEMNALRTKPSDFAIMLENMLAQFPAGRRLQVLSAEEQARLEGISFGEPEKNAAMKYAVMKALTDVKRFRGGNAGALQFNNALFLAANEHCGDIAANGATGSVGSDGKTLPTHRAAQYADVVGLEDLIVGGANGLTAVLNLLLDDQAENIVNGYYTQAGVASCVSAAGPTFVVYLAEQAVANAAANSEIAKLSVVRSPTDESAEAALLELNATLKTLVQQENAARMMGDVIKQAQLKQQIDGVWAQIKGEQAKIEAAKLAAAESKAKARAFAEEVAALEGQIEIAEGELALAVAKKERLVKAKDILVARGTDPMMTQEEEEDFARSISSFIKLVEKCAEEVAAKQAVVDDLKAALTALVNPQPAVIAVVEEIIEPVAPAPAPVVAPPAPKGPTSPEFDKMLPSELGGLPTDAMPATDNEFDRLVPGGLKSQPLGDAEGGAAAGDAFGDLLPASLADMTEGAPSASATAFPISTELSNVAGDANDVTADEEDADDDADFSDIIGGIDGAAELVSGGRRLQAEELLFGSPTLAL